MELTVFNPQKGRLETIRIQLSEENTTYFDAYKESDISMIADYRGGVIIKEYNYNYPVWVYDISRKNIGNDKRKARQLISQDNWDL